MSLALTPRPALPSRSPQPEYPIKWLAEYFEKYDAEAARS
jgi:hypothetical protein